MVYINQSDDSLHCHLTNREIEVLTYLAGGYSTKQMATRLQIAESTTKNHVTAIMRKLDANNRAHAVALAMQLDLITVKSSVSVCSSVTEAPVPPFICPYHQLNDKGCGASLHGDSPGSLMLAGGKTLIQSFVAVIRGSAAYQKAHVTLIAMYNRVSLDMEQVRDCVASLGPDQFGRWCYHPMGPGVQARRQEGFRENAYSILNSLDRNDKIRNIALKTWSDMIAFQERISSPIEWKNRFEHHEWYYRYNTSDIIQERVLCEIVPCWSLIVLLLMITQYA